MCTLVFAVVPASTEISEVSSARVSLRPTHDATLAVQLAAGEQLCTVRGVPECSGGGHCGTVLGSEARGKSTEARRDGRDEAQANKLRRSGWSERKVTSWLTQRREARSHRVARGDELALWSELLRSALVDRRLPYLGLVVLEAGDEIARSEEVSFGACDLTTLESGVLYRLRR